MVDLMLFKESRDHIKGVPIGCLQSSKLFKNVDLIPKK